MMSAHLQRLHAELAAVERAILAELQRPVQSVAAPRAPAPRTPDERQRQFVLNAAVGKAKRQAGEALGAGVHAPTYTRAPWSADTPAIQPAHVVVQVCPSPPHFGPAAKLHAIGAAGGKA